MLRRLGTVVLLCLGIAAYAQTTTVTINNTVALPNINRPSLNLGENNGGGSAQYYRDLENVSFAGFPTAYWRTGWYCNTGGTNDTTHWYSNVSNSGGYPANFWVGATYRAYAGATGALLGTGTITASSANTSTGMQFTLGTALSSACNTSNADQIFVDLTGNNTLLTPNQISTHCGNCSFETTDIDPVAQNQYAALEMTSGGSFTAYTDQNYPDSANTTSTTGVPWINVNGNYSVNFKSKCISPCTVSYQVTRNTSNFINGTVTPTYNTSPGVGWTSYTENFTASENGSQGHYPIAFVLSCTSGTCLFQDSQVVEGTAISPTNSTAFRDSVVRHLRLNNPGSIRYMDPTVWCSTAQDMWASADARRVCSESLYVEVPAFATSIGYNDVLTLAYQNNWNVLLTAGNFWTAADMTYHINQLGNTQCAICGSGQTWNSLFAAAGLTIITEMGNEPWNTSTGVYIGGGTGKVYGALAEVELQAAKAATGYNSAVDKLAFAGWGVTNAAAENGSWTQNMMTSAGCTLAAPSNCPDYVTYAGYMLNTLNNTTNTFQDIVAEITNTASTTNSASLYNIKLAQSYAKTNYNVNTLVYEYSLGLYNGTATPSQATMNQISAGVGEGMTMYEYALLMQRDASMPGAAHQFQFGGGTAASVNSTVHSSWNDERYIACGPGQITTCSDIGNAIDIVWQVGNTAIGTNTNLATTSQSGTPTFNYTGGQGGQDTIPANSAVPYVNVFAYCNSSNGTTCAGTRYTLFAFNHDQTNAHTVSFTGAGAPLSSTSVTRTVIGGAVNALTDNNTQCNLVNGCTPPVVLPTGSVGTGYNTDTLPAASMVVYTYSETPTVATPVISPATGTYGSAQTVTITDSTSGAVIHYTLNGTTPTAASPIYDTSMTVASTGTIKAIAIATGYANSAVASSTLTISSPVSIKCSGGASIKYAGGIVVTCSTTP